MREVIPARSRVPWGSAAERPGANGAKRGEAQAEGIDGDALPVRTAARGGACSWVRCGCSTTRLAVLQLYSASSGRAFG